MIELVSKVNPSGYSLSAGAKTITDAVNRKLNPAPLRRKRSKTQRRLHQKRSTRSTASCSRKRVRRNWPRSLWPPLLSPFSCGVRGSGVGATDVLVAVLLYLFGILPIEEISKAYMQDAVFFIFGILAVAVGVAKTGLDKRIGLILLSRVKSAKSFAFLFFPMIAMSASFLSEHALVALLILFSWCLQGDV